jgi:hypothetical protein
MIIQYQKTSQFFEHCLSKWRHDIRQNDIEQNRMPFLQSWVEFHSAECVFMKVAAPNMNVNTFSH